MRIEVLWKDPPTGVVLTLEFETEAFAPGQPAGSDLIRAGVPALRMSDILTRLPADLQERLARGELSLASHGQTRSPDSVLMPGDRIELLGPITMDARAGRAARVKQVRARQRGPYNRSYSGKAAGPTSHD